MKIGGLNHLITNPRDMKASSPNSPRSATRASPVNTLFNGLLNTPGFEQPISPPRDLAAVYGRARGRRALEKVTG